MDVGTATKPFTLLKDLVFLNPVVTGPLLYILTRGPENVRNTLLRGAHIDAIAPYINTTDGDVAKALIFATKVLLATGILAKLNKFLTRLALNQWSLAPKGQRFDFKTGKEIICITGGSSGFGALMVKDFSEKTNATIVVIDVQDLPADLKALPKVHFYKCDLSQTSQIKEVTDAIKSEVGDPTVLINNAGIGKSCTILNATPEWIEKIFRVNLLSHWATVGAFLPAMLKAKKGHVVTMASAATFVSVAGIADYCATKAGLMAFHEGLNQELKHSYENGRCIQTTIIHPTFAKTPLVTAGMAAANVGSKQAGKLLPPEMITHQVVKQVLAGTSAQIFVPKNASRSAALRGYPTWFQEVIRDFASKMTSSK